MMRWLRLLAVVLLAAAASPRSSAQALPFQYRAEVYRDATGGTLAFALRLEQPFLAEEFEQSSDLSLRPLDRNSFLVYPRRTRFHQKHAEFYGRLRGSGKARLELSFSVVSEELDGSRRIEPRTTEIEIAIPEQPVGLESLLTDWARQQNAYFEELLAYAPDASFFEYVLLQSSRRYGVAPPELRKPSREQIEKDLYYTFSGGLAVQQALQRDVLEAADDAAPGPAKTHISALSPPALRSLPYESMLRERHEHGIEPAPEPMARLVPEDQYFCHFNSMHALDELMGLTHAWGANLLRLITVRAREQNLRGKIQDQLCLPCDPASPLFRDTVISDIAVTGSDMFLSEGSDLTVLMRLAQPDAFAAAVDRQLADIRTRFPALVEREFHYRGRRIAARYTEDRVVSSFMLMEGDVAIVSNSHRAIRRIADTLAGATRSLHDALDYRYVTTVLPPERQPTGAYLYASDAFLRRLVAPDFKISEKRRLQCFNNLVMLNNASLFFRLETGRSPATLAELVDGRYIDADAVVCPHGGAYAIDTGRDTCTCSLHNRLKYLTPNVELEVLQVTDDEKEAYERYKVRYQKLWQRVFDPVAVRFDLAARVKLEVAVLPFANGAEYGELRDALRDAPAELDLRGIASSAVLSVLAVPGSTNVAETLRALPGVGGLLDANPTLTDLAWLGDRASVHLCDGPTIVEVDPARIEEIDLFGKRSVTDQAGAALALSALTLPMYVTLELRDAAKGQALLDALSTRAFLETGKTLGLRSACDAYRLPDYRAHAIHVVSYQLYALKLRLSVAVVGSQLVAATRPETLRQVIDASLEPGEASPRLGHVVLRLNRRAVKQLEGDLRVYWAEKAREACHRNVMSIGTLARLYEIPVSEVGRLSDAKYGVVDLCPDGGTYSLDAVRDQVTCSVHGNRFDSRLDAGAHGDSSFAQFIDTIDEIVAGLRFDGDNLIATVEIARTTKP